MAPSSSQDPMATVLSLQNTTGVKKKSTRMSRLKTYQTDSPRTLPLSTRAEPTAFPVCVVGREDHPLACVLVTLFSCAHARCGRGGCACAQGSRGGAGGGGRAGGGGVVAQGLGGGGGTRPRRGWGWHKASAGGGVGWKEVPTFLKKAALEPLLCPLLGLGSCRACADPLPLPASGAGVCCTGLWGAR